MAGGLMHIQEYKGLEQPRYYVADIAFGDPVAVSDQSTATAKTMVGRISMAGLVRRQVRDFFGRKLW